MRYEVPGSRFAVSDKGWIDKELLFFLAGRTFFSKCYHKASSTPPLGWA